MANFDSNRYIAGQFAASAGAASEARARATANPQGSLANNASQAVTPQAAALPELPPSQGFPTQDNLFPVDTFLNGQYGFLIEKEFAFGRKSSDLGDGALIKAAVQERRILLFQSEPKLTESKSAVWSPHNIIGRAEPILSYNYSDSRVFQLATKYWVDSTSGDNRETLLRRINYIRSLVNPEYNLGNGGVNPPKVYLLYAGDFWSGVSVVIENYSLDYPEDAARFTSVSTGSTPMFVDVAMSLREVNTDDELIHLVRSYTGRR